VFLHTQLGAAILAIAVCKAGAIGAYFIGKYFGRTPLCPRVSPRKTVAGGVAAVVAGLLVVLFFHSVASPFRTVLTACLFGLAVAVAAVMGDLTFSLLKRDAGIKDSGTLLPGFGGVLDMLDDILLTAPIALAALLLLS